MVIGGLMALLMLLGGGGGAALFGDLDELRSNIETVVPKGDRRDAALDTIDEIEDVYDKLNDAALEAMNGVGEAISEYSTDNTELTRLVEEYAKNRRKAAGELIDLRFKLKENITRSEWAHLFPKP